MTIDRQSDADLSALMHNVYMHMMTDPDSKTQVAQMNDIVVREATKTIQTGILQQLSYVNFITKSPTPLSLPISTTTHGNKMSSNDKYGF